MRYPASFLEELKTRVPVSALVSKRVKLRRQGREWAGLSPFNQEKTPSFFVNDQKGFWHCFSSGKHGDQIGWLTETQGLSFVEAVESLANEAGLEVPKASPERVKQEARRLALIDVVEAAARWFAEQLKANDGARRYLAGRGIGREAVERFRIGFAPDDRSALQTWLGRRGATTEQIVEAGLAVVGDGLPKPIDRFRNRVIIPIVDEKGRAIAFGGRALGDGKPKYLNSPETPLFHKGGILFNGPQARQACWDGADAVVVEGYMDVITPAMAGFGGMVAPMGTALTEDQLRLLWRMSDEPILCFDGDAAGQKAAQRAIDVALPHIGPGRSLRFAVLPSSEDPDSLVRKRGASAFAAHLKSARSMVDLVWARVMEGRSLDTPERVTGAKEDIRKIIEPIPDKDVRRAYWSDLEGRVFQATRRKKVVRSNGHSLHSASPGSSRLVFGAQQGAGISLKEAALLSSLVAAPSEAADAAERLATQSLSPDAQHAVDQIVGVLAMDPEASPEAVLAQLNGSRATVDQAMAMCRASGLAALLPGGNKDAAVAAIRSA